MITSLPEKGERPTSDWLVFPKPNQRASFRLFCFPYAGAGSMVYSSWPDGLPDHVEVISLLYPGRESCLRVSPFISMHPMINVLVEEIIPKLDRPFAFFGHSMGGLIAFELARELRRRQCSLPTHLFISSRRAPHLPSPLTTLLSPISLVTSTKPCWPISRSQSNRFPPLLHRSRRLKNPQAM